MSTTFLSQPGRPQCLDPTLHSASPMLWIHATLDSLGVRGPVSLIKSVHSFLSIWTSWTYCYFFPNMFSHCGGIGAQAASRCKNHPYALANSSCTPAPRCRPLARKWERQPERQPSGLIWWNFGAFRIWEIPFFVMRPVFRKPHFKTYHKATSALEAALQPPVAQS